MRRFLLINSLVVFFILRMPYLFGLDISDEILINHVGYPPKAGKFCLMKGDKPMKFYVLNMQTGKKDYQGSMELKNGIIGEYLVGDFSAVKEKGTYQIVVGKKKSPPFSISENVYDDALQKCVTYFSIQRCGPSTTGYAAPCHVDDGRRLDTGPGRPLEPHRDVSGGWHDACDFRKWVNFTLYGMTGLNRVAENMGNEWHRDQILEELRWGNRYFLNMQDESGFVMNYCSGDDGGYLTDNIPGTEDDRPIHTEPASFVHSGTDRTAQYVFIQAQAQTSRTFKSIDPEYSKKCLNAAIRCQAWCYQNFYANTALEIGSALLAYMELYKASGEKRFLEEAIVLARRLVDLQMKEPVDEKYGIHGFFKTSTRDPEPSRHGWHGPQHILGLCMLVETTPDHPDAKIWREAIRLYSEEFIAKLTTLHTFNLAPLGLYLSEDPGGNNKIGDYWVRYLSVTAGDAWDTGINPKVASAGIGLLYASRILGNDNLKKIAQRQLDWIIGANPLNMSTVEEVGRNQPIRMINRKLKIPPLIPGAVMNGIGGTLDEQVHLEPGSWKECEYWTLPTSHTMWLMAELQNALK
jgi:hypothetical protein